MYNRKCNWCGEEFETPFHQLVKCNKCALPKAARTRKLAERRRYQLGCRIMAVKYSLEYTPELFVEWISTFDAKKGFDGYVGKCGVPMLRFSIQKVKKRSQLVFKVNLKTAAIRVEGRCKRLWHRSRFGNNDYKHLPGRSRKNMFLRQGVCACKVCEMVDYLNERLRAA